MKIIRKISLLAVLIICLFNTVVFGANNVSEIDIDVTVRDDGSAYIVQNWKGTFDEGTENYIPVRTGDIEITDFKVSDANGQYENISAWDVDASFADKAGKCGIVKTDDGVELCFGITEYGTNRYAIEYVVKGFVKSYTDYDGTNFMFINPHMSTFPTDGHITIGIHNGTTLTEDNAGIWAFGYDGYVEFEDGIVNARTTTPLEGNNSMIIMLRMDKGIVSPAVSVDKSFEEIKDEAFEGSDYADDDADIVDYIMLAVVLLIILLFIWVIVFLIARKVAIKKFFKETDYFRDVPNGGSMEVSYYLSRNFDVADEDSLIIGALMLSMINNGCLEPVSEKNVGFFGKEKQTMSIQLVKSPQDFAESMLYDVLVSASGKDGILQEKELEKYAFKNYEKVNGVMDKIKKAGEEAFSLEGGFVKNPGNCIKNLSDKGKEELGEVAGLKKYLEDFTLISEREIAESVIWKEYMVYATLFGIADKVMEQFKNVYPEKIQEFDTYNRNRLITYSYYRSMHRSAHRAAQLKRSGGGGGSSSFGGGGGFSGGGSGGGSR